MFKSDAHRLAVFRKYGDFRTAGQAGGVQAAANKRYAASQPKPHVSKPQPAQLALALPCYYVRD